MLTSQLTATMFVNACKEYLNNLNNFIISRPTTGLAKHLGSQLKYNKNGTVNSVLFWQTIEDYVKPGFLSDKEYRDDIDEMIMRFNYYKKELFKMLSPADNVFLSGDAFDWINWYCSLPTEKINMVDCWYDSK
jgi:hypothetical protein